MILLLGREFFRGDQGEQTARPGYAVAVHNVHTVLTSRSEVAASNIAILTACAPFSRLIHWHWTAHFQFQCRTRHSQPPTRISVLAAAGRIPYWRTHKHALIQTRPLGVVLGDDPVPETRLTPCFSVEVFAILHSTIASILSLYNYKEQDHTYTSRAFVSIQSTSSRTAPPPYNTRPFFTPFAFVDNSHSKCSSLDLPVPQSNKVRRPLWCSRRQAWQVEQQRVWNI
jgi:hypothetical protein